MASDFLHVFPDSVHLSTVQEGLFDMSCGAVVQLPAFPGGAQRCSRACHPHLPGLFREAPGFLAVKYTLDISNFLLYILSRPKWRVKQPAAV